MLGLDDDDRQEHETSRAYVIDSLSLLHFRNHHNIVSIFTTITVLLPLHYFPYINLRFTLFIVNYTVLFHVIYGIVRLFLHFGWNFSTSNYVRAYTLYSPCRKTNDFPASLADEVYIVTGANAGLGLVTAEALARQQAEVHCICRNQARGEEAVNSLQKKTGNSRIFLHVVDVSDQQAIRKFTTEWIQSKRKLNCLINNAGVLLPERSVNKDNHEVGMATAMYQSYLLTSLLLPVIVQSSTVTNPGRIIHVSSGGGLTVKLDLADLQSEKRSYNGTLQYAHAKRAQMELNKVWYEKLSSIGKASSSSSSTLPVITSCMHPGWAGTEGVKSSISDFYEKNKDTLRNPEEGADTIVWLASSITGRSIPSGKFWFDRAEASTDFSFGGTTLTNAERDTLWKKMEEMTHYNWDTSEEKKLLENYRSSSSSSGNTSSGNM